MVRFSGAACYGADSDVFFPSKGGTAAAARAICEDCPVRQQCEAFAMDLRMTHGVWGGTTEKERRRLRKAAA